MWLGGGGGGGGEGKPLFLHIITDKLENADKYSNVYAGLPPQLPLVTVDQV